jgi:hypothetical protein
MNILLLLKITFFQSYIIQKQLNGWYLTVFFFYLFNYNNQCQFLLLKNHMFDEKNYHVIICTLVFLIKMGRARVGYKGMVLIAYMFQGLRGESNKSNCSDYALILSLR